KRWAPRDPPIHTDFLGDGVRARLALAGVEAAPPLAASPLAPVPPNLPPPGTRIQASGNAVGGVAVNVPAEQQPDGSVVLIDATAPGADRASAHDVTSVHDGR